MVHDDMIRAAANAIVREGYPLCANRACPEFQEDRLPEIDSMPDETEQEYDAKLDKAFMTWQDRFHPIAEAHFHAPAGYVLSLHRKSRLLWWLPDFPVRAPPLDDPYLVRTTDFRRLPARGLEHWPGVIDFDLEIDPATGESTGPWRYQDPVTILSIISHVEALILLLCRDFHLNRRLDWRWFNMLTFVGERKVPGEDIIRYKLRGELQPFWDQLRGHTPVAPDANILAPLYELRDKLIKEDRLPGLPPANYSSKDLYQFELTKDWATDASLQRSCAGKARRWIEYKMMPP